MYPYTAILILFPAKIIKISVGCRMGLEPMTSGSTIRRSDRLNYQHHICTFERIRTSICGFVDRCPFRWTTKAGRISGVMRPFAGFRDAKISPWNGYRKFLQDLQSVNAVMAYARKEGYLWEDLPADSFHESSAEAVR